MSWGTVPLRRLITSNNRRNRPDLPLLSVVRDKGVIKRSFDKSDNHNIIPEDLSNYKVVSEGQFVINKMKAWQGSCGVSSYDGIVSPAYYVFDLKIDNPRFFNYAIRSRTYIDEFNRISSGIRVDQWDLSLLELKYLLFKLPSRDEQDQIVRFLDWKVSQINRLINAKRRQIGLLREQRQVIISNMLSTVSLNSGSIKFKRLVVGANTGVSITREYWDEDGKLHLYTAGQIPLRTNYSSFPSELLTTQKDILVARNGAGSVHLPIDGSVYTDHVIRFSLSSKIERNYLYYALLVAMKKIEAEANVVSLKTLNKSDWERADIPYPQISEQNKIAEILNKRCSAIDTVIDTINREIILFTEYRTRLISDVVTGKLDVRDIVVPEYVSVEEDSSSDGDDIDNESVDGDVEEIQ